MPERRQRVERSPSGARLNAIAAPGDGATAVAAASVGRRASARRGSRRRVRIAATPEPEGQHAPEQDRYDGPAQPALQGLEHESGLSNAPVWSVWVALTVQNPSTKRPRRRRPRTGHGEPERDRTHRGVPGQRRSRASTPPGWSSASTIAAGTRLNRTGCQVSVASAVATPAHSQRRRTSSSNVTTSPSIIGSLASGPPVAPRASTWMLSSVAAAAAPASREPNMSRPSR